MSFIGNLFGTGTPSGATDMTTPGQSQDSIPTVVIHPESATQANVSPAMQKRIKDGRRTATGAVPGPVVLEGGDIALVPQAGSVAAATATPSPVVAVTAVPPFGQSMNEMVNAWVQPNPLNPYFQSTYHFRLFMIGDGDLVGTTTTSFTDFMSRIGSVEQVTIAESGVTGYNIKDVTFETIISQTSTTRDTKATTWTMTIVEPMGVSFFDALYYAAKKLGVQNYNKMVYYVQLCFKGYDEQGVFNPLTEAAGFLNGGQWIWALTLTTVETKINEGGAIYTLNFVTVDSGSALYEADKIAADQTLTVEGATLKGLFTSYAKSLTDSWTKQYGENNTVLVEFAIDASHAVPLGPGQSKVPDQFKLIPTHEDKQTKRNFTLQDKGPNAQPAGQVAKGTSINAFITDAIKSTEEGQALIKSVTQKGAIDDPARPIREATLFTIETDVRYTGKYDTISGHYTKLITLHVVPFYTQALLLSAVQRDNAKSPDVQRQMVQKLGTYGLVKKRYDYIFTGKNTEVIDFNIHFNMAFQSILPKFGGGQLNYALVGIPPRYEAPAINTQAPFPVDPNCQVDVVPDAAAALLPGGLRQSPLPIPANSLVDANKQAFDKRFAAGGGSAVQSIYDKRFGATQNPTVGGAAQTSSTPAASTPTFGKGTNTYIEDLMNQVNQGQPVDTVWRPLSFQTGDANVQREIGVGFPGQHGNPDPSFVGAAFANMYSVTGDLCSIEMTIRGDPYWLGQCNVERQIVLRNGLPVYDKNNLPDWSSNQPGIFVYFRYPTQVGDDFKPVLNTSNVLNGLYNVNTVNHTFADGVYKQVLHATIMPLINLAVAFSSNPSTTNDSGAASSPTGQNGNSIPTTGATPGSGGSTIAPSGSLPNAAQQALAKNSYDFWISQGYPPGAAAGMVAQEQAETQFGTNPRTNSSPVAQGNFQWSPSRAAAIQAATGINVSTASHAQQLQAAAWELSAQGPERASGVALKSVGDDGGLGGQVASLKYERPGLTAAEQQAAAQKRGAAGALWAQTFNNGTPPQ